MRWCFPAWSSVGRWTVVCVITQHPSHCIIANPLICFEACSGSVWCSSKMTVHLSRGQGKERKRISSQLHMLLSKISACSCPSEVTVVALLCAWNALGSLQESIDTTLFCQSQEHSLRRKGLLQQQQKKEGLFQPANPPKTPQISPGASRVRNNPPAVT